MLSYVFMCYVLCCDYCCGLYSLVGMGWRVFLGLSSLLVSVMMEEGLYIAYLVTYTSYARTRLSGGMSPVIGMCYFLVGLVYFLCQLASVLLTLRSDEFRWSLLRHASTTSLLLFISIYSGLLIYRLKRYEQLLHVIVTRYCVHVLLHCCVDCVDCVVLLCCVICCGLWS